MPLKHSRNIKELMNSINEFAKKDAPRVAGVEGVKFFKDRFIKQGWEDRSFEPWESRKSRDRQSGMRKVLVQSGRLMNSIQYQHSGSGRIIVSAKDIPYAQIHNEGGTISTTQSVRSHKRRTRSGSTTVRSHSRKVNTDIPQRKFMGTSAALNSRIEMIFKQRLQQILKA